MALPQQRVFAKAGLCIAPRDEASPLLSHRTYIITSKRFSDGDHGPVPTPRPRALSTRRRRVAFRCRLLHLNEVSRRHRVFEYIKVLHGCKMTDAVTRGPDMSLGAKCDRLAKQALLNLLYCAIVSRSLTAE